MPVKLPDGTSARTGSSVLFARGQDDVGLRKADRLAALVRANGWVSTREATTMAQFEAAFAQRRAFILERVSAVRAELSSVLR